MLQWVPAHCSISGNEKADELAREPADLQAPAGASGYPHHYRRRGQEGCRGMVQDLAGLPLPANLRRPDVEPGLRREQERDG